MLSSTTTDGARRAEGANEIVVTKSITLREARLQPGDVVAASVYVASPCGGDNFALLLVGFEKGGAGGQLLEQTDASFENVGRDWKQLVTPAVRVPRQADTVTLSFRSAAGIDSASIDLWADDLSLAACDADGSEDRLVAWRKGRHLHYDGAPEPTRQAPPVPTPAATSVDTSSSLVRTVTLPSPSSPPAPSVLVALPDDNFLWLEASVEAEHLVYRSRTFVDGSFADAKEIWRARIDAYASAEAALLGPQIAEDGDGLVALLFVDTALAVYRAGHGWSNRGPLLSSHRALSHVAIAMDPQSSATLVVQATNPGVYAGTNVPQKEISYAFAESPDEEQWSRGTLRDPLRNPSLRGQKPEHLELLRPRQLRPVVGLQATARSGEFEILVASSESVPSPGEAAEFASVGVADLTVFAGSGASGFKRLPYPFDWSDLAVLAPRTGWRRSGGYGPPKALLLPPSEGKPVIVWGGPAYPGQTGAKVPWILVGPSWQARPTIADPKPCASSEAARGAPLRSLRASAADDEPARIAWFSDEGLVLTNASSSAGAQVTCTPLPGLKEPRKQIVGNIEGDLVAIWETDSGVVARYSPRRASAWGPETLLAANVALDKPRGMLSWAESFELVAAGLANDGTLVVQLSASKLGEGRGEVRVVRASDLTE